MQPKFKLYGYIKESHPDGIIELRQVSLCFRDSESVREFAQFVVRCAEGIIVDANWEHEHFFSEAPHIENVVISILDKRNYD